MPDAHGNLKPFALTSSRARAAYDRCFPPRPAARIDSGMDAPPGMTTAEATRQYQATLEARRTLRTATDGLVSFEPELEAADRDVEEAAAHLFNAWMST